MRKGRSLAVLLVSCLALAGSAGATTVAKLAPKQVDALADRIFEGRCASAKVVTPAGAPAMPVTEYRFELERVLKGPALAASFAAGNRTLVVRQVAGRSPDGSAFGIVGVPEYVPGARYRLALNADSALGLTSPVGLGQGVTLLERAPSPATEPSK